MLRRHHILSNRDRRSLWEAFNLLTAGRHSDQQRRVQGWHVRVKYSSTWCRLWIVTTCQTECQVSRAETPQRTWNIRIGDISHCGALTKLFLSSGADLNSAPDVHSGTTLSFVGPCFSFNMFAIVMQSRFHSHTGW